MSSKKIVLVCAQSYEPDWLVEEFVQNISPIVDEYHIIDNTKQVGPWHFEGDYRKQQRSIAKQMGGDWFLLSSPDERFEDGAAEEIRRTVDTSSNRASYTFRVCELWTPEEYRIDGQFGPQRHRLRLFPVEAMFGSVYHRRIHSPIIRQSYKNRKQPLESRIYHTKQILPENRELRVDIMKKLDDEAGIKRRDGGWDEHLQSPGDEGVLLERIPEGRGFTPELSQLYKWEPREGFTS